PVLSFRSHYTAVQLQHALPEPAAVKMLRHPAPALATCSVQTLPVGEKPVERLGNQRLGRRLQRSVIAEVQRPCLFIYGRLDQPEEAVIADCQYGPAARHRFQRDASGTDNKIAEYVVISHVRPAAHEMNEGCTG